MSVSFTPVFSDFSVLTDGSILLLLDPLKPAFIRYDPHTGEVTEFGLTPRGEPRLYATSFALVNDTVAMGVNMYRAEVVSVAFPLSVR